MTLKYAAPLIFSLLQGCSSTTASLSSPKTQQKLYNAGYNAAAQTCNDVRYYEQKYNKSGKATSPAASLWGLIITPDIGYADSINKLTGQKDAINNIPPINEKTLYSQASFLNKCNYNPDYAQYCKTAYKQYMLGYSSESANLQHYDDPKQYINGFNDATNDCNKEYMSPPPKPVKLKD